MDKIPEWLKEYSKKVISENNYDSSHDLTHFINTCNYAEYIIQKDFINCELIPDLDWEDARILILYAAFSHDLIDSKYVDSELYKIKLKNLFLEYNYPEEYVNIILYIIDNISFSKQRKGLQVKAEYVIAVNIVSDADKLDAYRPERIIAYQNTKSSDQDTCKNWLKTILTVRVLEYKDKWLKTAAAKSLAEPLHLQTVEYIEKYLTDAKILPY